MTGAFFINPVLHWVLETADQFGGARPEITLVSLDMGSLD